MAEYSEYQRRRSHTSRERSPKRSYGKKFVLQLITSIVIFTTVCAPLSPEIFKKAAKSALSYKPDTTIFVSTINRILNNTETEENTNENTKTTVENI